MKKLLYILVSLSILACKPQKSVVEYKYINKTDTLIRTQINTIYKGISDTILINNPCDSTGILNHFYAKINIPNGFVKINSNKGRIEAIVKSNDIISTDAREKSKSNLVSTLQASKEVIKYRIPTAIIVALFVETIIILLYLYIKFFIK